MDNSKLRIRTVQHLALRLGIAEDRLLKLGEEMKRHVREVLVPKDDGGIRKAYAASAELAVVHNRLRTRMLDSLPLPKGFHGSVRGHSPVTNATAHVRKATVANTDIQDFYPSIHHSRVYRLFVKLECSPHVARILTRLTTYNSCLAQGFSTSPMIANLVLAQVWPRVRGLEKSMQMEATAYVDDLTLSGARHTEAALGTMETILVDSGFDINYRKRRVMSKNEQQSVNKLVVNDKVNVPKQRRRELRSEIYRASRLISKAAEGDSSGKLLQRLQGRLAWARHANPQWGERLARILNGLQHPDGNR